MVVHTCQSSASESAPAYFKSGRHLIAMAKKLVGSLGVTLPQTLMRPFLQFMMVRVCEGIGICLV
jgi:hypothetical protein